MEETQRKQDIISEVRGYLSQFILQGNIQNTRDLIVYCTKLILFIQKKGKGLSGQDKQDIVIQVLLDYLPIDDSELREFARLSLPSIINNIVNTSKHFKKVKRRFMCC